MSDLLPSIALAVCLLLATGCTERVSTEVLPDYTAGEAKCMAEVEVNTDIALAKCAEKHGVAICSKAESDVIEQTQIEETMKCLERY